MAPGLDNAALVEVERAEGAIAETAAIARDREAHFGKGRDACRVRGMHFTGIGQRVDGIHLGHGERL